MHSKIPNNLPDMAAAIKKQSAYDTNREEMAKFDKFVKAKIKAAMDEYYEANPTHKTKFGYVDQGRPYVKRPGSHVIVPTIVQHLLYKDGLTKTKTAILEAVREKLPKQAAHIHDNIWYNKLKPPVWKRLQEIINGNSVKQVKINGCKDLDSIRDRLIAASVTESATFNTKVSITIDKEKVVIGKEVYNIVSNTSKGKTYPTIRTSKGGRKQSLNVEVLKIFLRQD